ncbi:MAG TPA: Gfo/Idh/MocA family oxidoreductase [Chloroflexota bacterium]|nr:Gfo/Idh/MocA family oxidoreductase [Chloroflexota bacterium]
MSINIAIIGAGNISRAHLSALRDSERGKVVGLYDADRSRAEARATEFGVARIYETWQDLLGDPNVRLVAVLVPPDLHARYTCEALEAGKDVLSEKPLGADVAECDTMIETARRAGRRLFPVQNRIYGPAYEAAHELIESGSLGTVFLAQTTGFEGPNTVFGSPWLAERRGGNGVLMAQAVHPAYSLRWLLGDVAEVTCRFGRRKVVQMTDEDSAIVTLLFQSGVLAEMTATFGLTNGPFDHGIWVFGNEGYLEIRNQNRNRTHPQSLRVISPQRFGDRDVHDVELPALTDGSSFRPMWSDNLRELATGDPARVSARDGRNAVEIIQAAHLSNERGQPVQLPLS